MARTESFSIQVHPNDEQNQINLMQRFHWNLLSSQEIKTVDSSLEKRGDKIYSVTKSENYIKLVFQRDLDVPNINKIKELESEYFSLEYPPKPSVIKPIPIAFVISIIIGIILESAVGEILGWITVILGTGLGVYITINNVNKRKQLTELYASNNSRREDILLEVDGIN